MFTALSMTALGFQITSFKVETLSKGHAQRKKHKNKNVKYGGDFQVAWETKFDFNYLSGFVC